VYKARARKEEDTIAHRLQASIILMSSTRKEELGLHFLKNIKSIQCFSVL